MLNWKNKIKKEKGKYIHMNALYILTRGNEKSSKKINSIIFS